MARFWLLTLVAFASANQVALPPSEPPSALFNLTAAINTQQSTFFSLPTGTYPTAIDWTSAFIGTLLASTTRTLAANPFSSTLAQIYFDHLTAFFYGQNVAALRNQAFDDMLWVVLGWLEGARTIDYRTRNNLAGGEWRDIWAARSKEFYELAERGYDEKLCGGGMLWSPHLEPYKNAITNELFIAASMEMYLFHPTPGGARNETYLQNAKRAYQWLRASNMTNSQSLYVDGFHVSTLNDPKVTIKKCDVRNEMVYTYNQGVLLTGLRGLAEVTGDMAYLEDGFVLVNAVLGSEGKVGEIVKKGVLTEKCDPQGDCSQDSQMFKAIFFHHLTRFCSPLPHSSSSKLSSSQLTTSCASIHSFILKNAHSAWSTRNSTGVAGSWWDAPRSTNSSSIILPPKNHQDPGAVDYRNSGEWSFTIVDGEFVIGGHGKGKNVTKGGDANDRGRGRTVESHAGALAGWRAVVEVVGA